MTPACYSMFNASLKYIGAVNLFFNFCQVFFTESKREKYYEILLSVSCISSQEFSHGQFKSWHAF